MSARHLAGLLVLVSLTAPPVVGAACRFACATESQHHGMAGGNEHAHKGMVDVRVGGHHDCVHDASAAELYSPSPVQRANISVGALWNPVLALDQTNTSSLRLTASASSPPGDCGLSPPDRSVVLLI